MAHSHPATAVGIHTAHAAGRLEVVDICRLAETCEEVIVVDQTQVCCGWRIRRAQCARHA
jgi:hypothetical protein